MIGPKRHLAGTNTAAIRHSFAELELFGSGTWYRFSRTTEETTRFYQISDAELLEYSKSKSEVGLVMEDNTQNTATLVSQYQYVRGESKREYDQIDTRMGWSLMAQTFLFGALALSSSTDSECSKSASDLIDTQRYRLVPILGLVTSFVPLMGIWGAHVRITDWRKKQYEIEKIPALGKGRIENYMIQ